MPINTRRRVFMITRTVLSVITMVAMLSSQSAIQLNDHSVPQCEVVTQVTSIEAIDDNDYCYFCDDRELTTREKIEELLWKCLTDEKNWLEDGEITEETYQLQIEPFNAALNYLPFASDEVVDCMYEELLWANLDWLEEDKAIGYEIDEGFYEYLTDELSKMGKY